MSEAPAQPSPTILRLVEDHVPSRIHQQDPSLYDFSPEARACASEFMGWADLSTTPPYPIADIQDFANEVIASGIESVILLGQGGSIQAPMTLAEYHAPEGNALDFYPIDSDSPVTLTHVFDLIDPETTLVIVASKSGGTIEPRVLLAAVRDHFQSRLSADELPSHFVAITDPGSALEAQALDEGWRAVFPGLPSVGGRFSALSVFGLVPAALLGLDLSVFISHGAQAERLCAEDLDTNPAVLLASFLYDAYCEGRDKFSLVTPRRAYTLCLWIEQLVAESTGKQGKGLLPNLEPDPVLLSHDTGDRSVVVYHHRHDLLQGESDSDREARQAYEESLRSIDPRIPRTDLYLGETRSLAQAFVIWEYATAMLGWLLEVCPFDQPDVASAKAKVLEILASAAPAPQATSPFPGPQSASVVELTASPSLGTAHDLRQSLRLLLDSLTPGDYFSLNAFLPYGGHGRLAALQTIRHEVAASKSVVANLEIGPRYLHSIGQLHKGGPNKGVFLILSADESSDIPVEGEKAPSLASLAKAQATGDFAILSERGRRCLHIHLPSNDAACLDHLAATIAEVLAS